MAFVFIFIFFVVVSKEYFTQLYDIKYSYLVQLTQTIIWYQVFLSNINIFQPIYLTLTATTTLGQSGLGSNANEEVFKHFWKLQKQFSLIYFSLGWSISLCWGYNQCIQNSIKRIKKEGRCMLQPVSERDVNRKYFGNCWVEELKTNSKNDHHST